MLTAVYALLVLGLIKGPDIPEPVVFDCVWHDEMLAAFAPPDFVEVCLPADCETPAHTHSRAPTGRLRAAHRTGNAEYIEGQGLGPCILLTNSN